MPKNPAVSRATRQPAPTNMMKLQIKTKVWLECGGTFVIGDGGLGLLRRIRDLRSLTKAAHAVGWSYRHAWGYLHNAERRLGAPLVTTAPGKGASRGTMLTESGGRVLRRLEQAGRAAGLSAVKQWRRA
jgi:molybdate transport system regulatory protein